MNKQIEAGEVLTRGLLKRLNGKQWDKLKIFGRFEIIDRRPHPIFLNAEVKIISIPASAIKGNVDLFYRDFKATMNATYFDIQIV